MTLSRRKDQETRRPPECRAELTRLNAEDLASSSSSSDNDEKEEQKRVLQERLQEKPKQKELPKGLPPNGKSLSRSGSKEENLLKRETSSLNGVQRSEGKYLIIFDFNSRKN
jgi:hypothetical protein